MNNALYIVAGVGCIHGGGWGVIASSIKFSPQFMES